MEKLYSNLIHVRGDGCAGFRLDYALGINENSALVLRALRDAMERQMYAPVQLQYDNASANTQAAVQALMGTCPRWRSRASHTGRGQSM